MFDNFRSWLARGDDNDPQPQARDTRPLAPPSEQRTEEPDTTGIDAWKAEYKNNPLIQKPVRNFASDVIEPGVSVDFPDEDADTPTVPSDYPFGDYGGMDLDAALERWLANAGVTSASYDADAADPFEQVVLDARGRRGAGIVEHAYLDPEERDYILGLRPFKLEDCTAYTRAGKAILLRPDDTLETDIEPGGVRSRGNLRRSVSRKEPPKTAAGKTAAFVQYDDVFLTHENDEIPLALDDVTFLPHDVDTGEVFGRPDTATVVDEAKAIRNQWKRLDDAIVQQIVGQWIAQVDTSDQSEATTLLNAVDPKDTDSPINVTNYEVELDQAYGEVPDITNQMQQQIEYILAAMPTPLYRVGFAGDINRDITTEQREDYRDEIRRERARLESAFTPMLRQKAKDFLFGDAKSDQQLPVDVRLSIEPPESDSPLEDEAFDADDLAAIMNAAGQMFPTGGASRAIPVHEFRERFLNIPPEPPDPPDGDDVDAAAALPDETDPRVQAVFDDAYLATRYSEGDPVVQAGGTRGVVAEVRTEDFEYKGTSHDASQSSPAYVVATENGSRVVAASELQKQDWTGDVDEDPTEDLQAAEARVPDGVTREAILARASSHLGHGSWSMPDSWRESDTPARLILLKAWAGMGGQFDCGGACCVGEMAGNVRTPDQFCAAMKDEVLGTHTWR